ncbi:MAG: hypothetical protein ACR2IQ_02590 [Minisyncoccia bacterium]
MKELDNKILEQFKIKSCQSVRHLIHKDVMYAVFITNRFRKIGWMAQVGEKYYGNIAKMSLKEKDDIIDYYVSIDKNAKDSIEQLI